MQLKNNTEGLANLFNLIGAYYQKTGDREVIIFDDGQLDEYKKIYVRYLLCKKHVIEYYLLEDRGSIFGGISLAIGPHYFGPAQFWSRADFKRFSLDTYPDDIEHNLRLMDEFLGYPVKPKFLP